MSEPDNPRWLGEIGDELRRDVPVRPAWRARLLDEVAHAPKPSASDAVDERFDDDLEIERRVGTRRRSITLSPAMGLAAAALFVALGAGVTYSVVSSRAQSRDRIASSKGASATPVPLTSSATTAEEREVVHFELSAPRASRVALVGSFNEWNPVTTPLTRDPATGKWVVSLRLPPGRHVYAFVVDGDVTADPAAPRAADDDFGSTNSVVLVSSPRT
jgi:Glycogen recognition site of AMP-activated protein kinase